MAIRLLCILTLLCSMGATVPEDAALQPSAASGPGSAELVRAATDQAVNSLFEQVADLELRPGLSVRRFLQDLDAEDELRKDLQRAEQLGGPRWLDRHTCQVQLRITSARVEQSLKRIASARPKASPLTAADIQLAVRGWPMYLRAAGSSVSQGQLAEIRPAPGAHWAQVAEDARRRALRQAGNNAARRSLESVRPVRLADRRTIGDAMAVEEVSRAVDDWLASRPVTRVTFRDDMEVEVALAVDGQEFFELVQSVLVERGGPPLPRDEAQWEEVRREFLAGFQPAIGRARVQGTSEAGNQKATLQLPQTPPVWVETRIEIQGSAAITGGKLRAAARAEADARAKLRQRLEALELADDLTVGQASQQHYRVTEALGRAVQQARIYKTEYRPDGTAVVHIVADLRVLWDELNR